MTQPRHTPTPSRVVRVGLVQHGCGPDRSANLDKACDLIRQAAGRGARIVATQELFTSTYFPQVEDTDRFNLAEPIPGPTSRCLGALARELGIWIVGSLFEERAPGVYHNTAVLIDETGRLACRYRKMHIPDDPHFYEKFYFSPGDAVDPTDPDTPDSGGWKAHDAGGVTVGMLVCWDQWFPEAARLTALRGAQVVFIPTAIGWQEQEPEGERARQREAWLTVQRAAAIANGLFMVTINRVGNEGELAFWGGSFVVGPGGEVIAQGSERSEEVLVVDCDLGRIDQARRDWPFLRDRRIDAYAGLMRRCIDRS